MNPISPRQQQALAAIRQHVRQHGFPPTTRELGRALGGIAQNAVWLLLARLERAGAIWTVRRAARGIRLEGGPTRGTFSPVVACALCCLPFARVAPGPCPKCRGARAA